MSQKRIFKSIFLIAVLSAYSREGWPESTLTTCVKYFKFSPAPAPSGCETGQRVDLPNFPMEHFMLVNYCSQAPTAEFLTDPEVQRYLLTNKSINLHSVLAFVNNFSHLPKDDLAHFYRNLKQSLSPQTAELLRRGARTRCSNLPLSPRPSTEPADGCLQIEAFSTEIAISAYETNVQKTFSDSARSLGVALVYRKSTPESRALQQNGRIPKPLDVKNKSAVKIPGYIPENPQAGKLGDEYRTLVAQCEKGHAPDCHKNLIDVQARLLTEDHLVEELKKGGKYQFIPLSRINENGQKEFMVFRPNKNFSVEWKLEAEAPTQDRAKVLANAEGIPITADTDLVMIGQPKNSELKVVYDREKGYRTPFSDRAIDMINKEWERDSQNHTKIVNHSDESMLGLNPINDLYVGIDPQGQTKEFDLTVDNPKRGEELRRYALWLKLQAETVDIPVPHPELQLTRKKKYLEENGIDMSHQDATTDYAKIIEIMGGTHKIVPLDFEDRSH